MGKRINNLLVEVEGTSWKKSNLMTATHRLIENDDYETEEGLPIWDLFDLDGNLIGHRIIPADYLEMDGDEDE